MTDPTTREFALALAERAGALLLDYHRRSAVADTVRQKNGLHDIVTAADLASERLITAALRDRFPQQPIYAEESATGAPPQTEWLWLIDPIDGTTNFAHGLPLFVVNIALAHHGVPVIGVTHDPSAGVTFWAEAGGGAWARRAGQDTRIRVSGTPELTWALLATGFTANRQARPSHNRSEFDELDLRSQSVRRLGSAAVALAWVAAGYLEAYWETGLKPWDFAPGWLLVQEAGGLVTQHDGGPLGLGSPTLAASNGGEGIHQPILAVLTRPRSVVHAD